MEIILFLFVAIAIPAIILWAAYRDNYISIVDFIAVFVFEFILLVVWLVLSCPGLAQRVLG